MRCVTYSVAGHMAYASLRVQCTAYGMQTPAGLLARAASDATRARRSFEARQKVRAGGIEVTARVRALAPGRLIVEYEDYKSPLAELDDLLGGSAELMGPDLVGSSLFYDGRTTSYVNSNATVALRSPGRLLYEPIPGIDVLGETRFLDDLARDYLLRDAGDGVEGGRPTRVLGLKPKQARAASVFRVVAYPFDRAEVAFDTETLFPLRITFVPSPDLPASPLLGPDPQIAIEYAGVRERDLDESVFTPSLPAGTRVFEESLVKEGEIGSSVPFPVPLDALCERGYELAGPRIHLVLDAARERGYATLVLAKRATEGQRQRDAVVLRVGNYLSRYMVRRRSFAAEHGEPVDLSGRSARYVSRRLALPDLPESVGAPALADLTWESGGVFWVLTAESLTQEDLLTLASSFA